MKIQREDLSSTKVKLSILADSLELEPIRRHVVGHFKNSVNVPGFRKGTAPIALVEKNINQQALLDEFMEHALNHLYGEALKQENIRPVSQPQVSLKKFVPFSELEFDAEMDILGPIKLPDYKHTKMAKPKATVTAKDVEGVLKSLQYRSAQRTEAERPAKNGDELLVDFSGSDKDGKPISGAEGKDYPLVLGSKNFIPGFEDNLIGLKAGEEKSFKLKFPHDYSVAHLQGADVTFTVAVKKVQELTEPPLDDNFAATVGPFITLKDLKADIKKQLLLEKQQQADRNYENELVKKLSDKTDLDVPEAMVEAEVLNMEEGEKRNLVYRGQTWQEHLEAEGITEEEHRNKQRPEAALRLKGGLMLSEIAEKEGLTVTDDELQERIALLKAQYQDDKTIHELDKPENQGEIRGRLLTEKTVAKLVEYASKDTHK